MGSNSSKPAEPQVFLPKTPTEFSPSLVSRLDSAVESDYTRSQQEVTKVQQRVSEELSKLRDEGKAALKEALEKLPAPKDDGKDDSISIKSKLDDLRAKLEQAPAPVQLSSEAKKARESLVKCFTDNKDRPLNCWDEVEAFKKVVRDA